MMLDDEVYGVSICAHDFVYGGIKYAASPPNEYGVTIINYYDWFYCKNCVKVRHIELTYKHTSNNVEKDVLFGATPIGVIND